MKIGYLGPRGTFTEQAALILAQNEELIPFKSFWEALVAVENGEIDQAIVPVENSIEGVVNATIDSLIFDVNLYVQELLIMPVEQSLIAKKGVKIEDIREIYSHSHAIPQCNEYLRKNLALATRKTVSSTAEGMKIVANSENRDIAAIGSKNAATLYGLEVLAEGIQDTNNNFTQFARVSKTKTDKIVNNKKCTICFSTENKPGYLYKMLEIFSIYDINMSKIASRPMRNKPMEYVFLIDIDVYDNAADVEDAIKLLKRKTSFFKNLGVYALCDKRN
jgi:prephenate dehydratase